MRLFALAVYLFLYVPIAVIAVFAFNGGRSATQLQGFSVQWFGRALSNPFVVDAFRTSLTVALASATLATVFGTMAALVLPQARPRLRAAFDALIYVAVMVPGIVIGIATLIALVTVFGWVNPVLAAVWPGEAPPQLGLGYGSLIAAHGLFALALVVLLVRARVAGMDRSLVEASADLGATPWGTFRQVTLPQIFPGILAGFLLAFTFSFDDFIIAFFVAGPQTTLPIYVFSSIRRGVTPEINAIGAMVLAASLTLLVVAQLLLRRGTSRARG
ncbi:Spermidine Putrescine ABC transporter permease component potC [Rubellimicrobium mesophilum DSM 19309]|uniref:Spermidine Putrescine ABC transporter permease component potC n=1 Tax=Rubellimicrobium mesophilum DSM 19309 TaxID=442562 RepID=A0A017HMK4_9RHOB|nr:ABC transporter permease [Rubellimicrobium mesophilum]EYD75571.1 Spermidine Putrescine ABC transporter permease component potC [Rubellimicrobium mesophilum DSM 19309]